MTEELKDCFKAECAKRELNTEDYMEAFCKRVEKKTITVPEDVAVYVKALKGKEDEANKPQKSQADRLVEYGLRAYLFLDEHDKEYARMVLPFVANTTNATNGISLTSHFNEREREEIKKEYGGNSVNGVSAVSGTRLITMPLHSSQFKKWLSEEMYNTEQKVPNTTAVYSAVAVLAGKTQRDGETHILYNRVAPDPNGNGFWIDMADENWRAIHVTAEGWEIVDKPPILFRRYKHQKALAVPVKVSEAEQIKTVHKFLEFVNIPKDGINQLMFMCVVISYFIPEITHPSLTLSGSQGSAKTWLFRFVKRLVDPSKHETLSLAQNETALIQQLDHSYLPFYDNINYLHGWQSDALCRAISGGGFSKRELYTDDEDIIYNFKRCVGLNGINVAAQSGDLLDRIIMFALEPISDEERRLEKELTTKFEKERPFIFGAVLSILSKTIRLCPSVKLQGFKRLADFTQWGCVIAQALGYTTENFESAYTAKVELQNEEALSASATAAALMMYCEKNFKYEKDEDGEQYFVKKTPTELFVEVTKFAEKNGIKTAKGYWAGDASHFMGEINKVKTNLGKVGCSVSEYHDGKQRWVIVDIKQWLLRRGNGKYEEPTV